MPDHGPLDLRVADRLTLAKPHPCGSRTWHVVRLGADIGLTCDGCAHRVLIERRLLERRVVSIERSAGEATG